MGQFTDRVVVVTGAGRGLGRAYALHFAELGAKVVVNSAGSDRGADGTGPSSAEEVAAEIRDGGGEAVAHTEPISNWAQAERLIDAALGAFGGVDVLVNNAGSLRDRVIANLTEDEWDLVLDVHLKGYAATMHFCAALWRDAHKAGTPVNAAVINTTAGAGLFGNPGQSNYAAAKAGVVALTLVTARELERYGVRVNAVAPVARTRLMMSTPALAEYVKAPDDPDEFDTFDPANVAPLVAYLASDECRFTGQVFNAVGGSIALYEGWSGATQIDKQGRWTAEELHAELGHLPAGPPAFAVPQPRK